MGSHSKGRMQSDPVGLLVCIPHSPVQDLAAVLRFTGAAGGQQPRPSSQEEHPLPFSPHQHSSVTSLLTQGETSRLSSNADPFPVELDTVLS